MARMDRIGKTRTSVFTENGETHVVYHQTPVVRFTDETVKLNTGGWFTMTTKTRMNQASNQFALGFQVYQKKGEWFVSFHDGRPTIKFDGNTLEFPRHEILESV